MGAGGTSPCMPRSLGSKIGIPAVEGVLVGTSSYASSCGGRGPEVWFLWTAPIAGLWGFDTQSPGSTAMVTLVDQVDGCGGRELSCDGSAARTVWIHLDAAETVGIVVDTDAASAGYVLNILGPGPEPGSVCPAVDIASRLGAPARTGRWNEATYSTVMPCGGGAGLAVTTRWSAPRSGYFAFDTKGSSFDTLLDIRRACDGASLGCSDNYTGTDSHLRLFFEAGQPAVILIGAS